MSLKKESIKRLVHYYQLAFSFDTDKNINDQIRKTFAEIVSLARAKDVKRYQTSNNKFLYINDISFVPADKYIKGKLLSVRTDLYPEIINMTNDEIRDIEAADGEGIVHTTHFIVYYGAKKTYLALEFNAEGARIQDFSYYLKAVPKKDIVLDAVDYFPVIRDDINEMNRRINSVSGLTVQLHKDNAQIIKEFDDRIASALNASLAFNDVEYANIDIKFSMKRNADKSDSRGVIGYIVDKIKANRINKDNVSKIQVTATDEDDNNRIAVFDLLVDKLKSHVTVEKKKNSRTVVSSDMFEKMWSQIVKQRLI